MPTDKNIAFLVLLFQNIRVASSYIEICMYIIDNYNDYRRDHHAVFAMLELGETIKTKQKNYLKKNVLF